MSTDLMTQLADYGRYHQNEQEPVDLTQIVGRDTAVRTLPPEEPNTPDRQPARTWWAAVAAAAIILLLVGGAAWLSQPEGTREPADQPPTTAPPTTESPDPETATAFGEWSRVEPTFSEGRSPQALTDAASTPFGLFAVGFGSQPVWTSQDGVEWTPIEEDTLQIEQPAFSFIGGSELGLVLIVPRSGSWYSPDGVQWTRLPDTVLGGSLEDFNAIAASERGFLVSAGNSLWFSADGLSWTKVPSDRVPGAGGYWFRVAANADAFYASGDTRTGDTAVWRSTDGMTWAPSLDGPTGISDLAASDLGVVGTTEDSTIWYTPDGEAWTGIESVLVPEGEAQVGNVSWKVGASNDTFLIAGGNGTDVEHRRAWVSHNGLTWTPISPPTPPEDHEQIYEIAPFNDGFIAVGDNQDGVLSPSVWSFTPGSPSLPSALSSFDWSRNPNGTTDGNMGSIVAGGPGLVAVGSGDRGAAVWTSTDGIEWPRVPHDEATFGGEGHTVMTNVTAGGPGLVAVGWTGPLLEQNSVVWTSPDGIEWSRVPHDDDVFGESIMNDVTVGGPGLVAVGRSNPNLDAMVWTSEDGLSWSRVIDETGVFSGNVAAQEIGTITAGGPGLVATGIGLTVWTSPDGFAWTRAFREPGDIDLTGVAVGGPGLVAVGMIGDPSPPETPSPGSEAAVWVSADGSDWSRVPHDETVFGTESHVRMNDVAVVGSTLVAVGTVGSHETGDAAVWASQDGAVWTRFPHDVDIFSDTEMSALIPWRSGVVVVGGSDQWIASQN